MAGESVSVSENQGVPRSLVRAKPAALDALLSSAFPKRLLVLALSLLPAYFILLIISRYAYNMPYQDEWTTLVPFYTHPGAPIGQFWQLYNEHRAFIPRVLSLMQAQLTAMNMLVTMVVDVGLAVATLGLLYLIYRKTATSSARYLILLPFSVLLFSLSQYPMWVLSVAFATYLVQFCLVAALAALVCLKPGWRALLLSALFAYVGALTLFPGNLIWLTLVGVIWGLGYRKRRFYMAWIIMAASVLIPYIIDYLAVPRDALALKLPDLLHFVLAMIGSPLAFGEVSSDALSVALPMGVFGLLMVSVLGVSIGLFSVDGHKKAVPWLAACSWVVGIAIFGAFGRVARFGPLTARQYRFMPYSALFWIGVVALIAIALTEPCRHDRHVIWQLILLRLVPVGAAFVIGIGFVNATLNFTESFEFFNGVFAKGHECLLSYESATDDCLTTLFPSPTIVRQQMSALVALNVSFLQGTEFALERAHVQTANAGYTKYETRLIDGTPTKVLFEHPLTAISWTLHLPAAAHISLVTGVLVDIPQKYEDAPSDGVLFEVSASSEDQPTTRLFRKLVLPRKIGQSFEPVTLDLTAYAGKSVTLMLTTRPGLNTYATDNYDWALWQPPSLIYGDR